MQILKQFQKYILFKFFKLSATVLFGTVLVIWITQTIRLVEVVSNKNIALPTFLLFSSLIIPYLVVIVMPFALFVTTILVYGKMTQDSELIAMQSFGISKIQLCSPALIVAIFYFSVCCFASLYLLPVSYSKFRELQGEIKNKYIMSFIKPGQFVRSQNSIVYAQSIKNSNNIDGLMIYSSPKSNANKGSVGNGNKEGFLLFAESATVEVGPKIENVDRQEVKFLLNNVSRADGIRSINTSVDAADADAGDDVNSVNTSASASSSSNGKDNINFTFMQSLSSTIDISTESTETFLRKVKPSELFIKDLLMKTGTAKEQSAFRKEAHFRLSWPISCVLVVLVSGAILLKATLARTKNSKTKVVLFLSFLYIVGTMLSFSFAFGGGKLWPIVYFNILAIFISGSLMLI